MTNPRYDPYWDEPYNTWNIRGVRRMAYLGRGMLWACTIWGTIALITVIGDLLQTHYLNAGYMFILVLWSQWIYHTEKHKVRRMWAVYQSSKDQGEVS